MPARNQKHPASEKQLPADVEPNGTEATLTDGAEPADKGVEWQSRAVEALRQSKEHLRVMADAIPQLAWIAHGDGFIHWYNRRWYEYTGTAPQEMEGWGWQSVHDPEMLPKVLERWKASIATGEPFEMVFPLRGADGRFRQFLTRVQPLKDSQGRVVQWFGTNTDVEELKRAQQALEEAMQRLRFHVENSPLAVIEFDADLRISRWTKEAERMFGWSAEEVCGKGMYELPWIHEEDRRKVDQVSDRLQSGQDSRNISPNRNYRKDGSVIHCEWYNSTLLDSSGKMASIFSLVLDVTARKQAEERLQALTQTLENRVAERTAMVEHRSRQLQLLAAQLTAAEQKERQRLALVLHDHLQQLLVGMKFSISMLRSHVQEDDDGPRIMQQLSDLVSQSIETSRSLTIELCPPILTKGTMSEVLHWLAGWFASKHGLRVEVQTDEQVHPPAEQVRVLLFQATRELLFNIVKHAGVDQARVEMTRREDGCACITVTDGGVGFDPAQVKPSGDVEGSFGLFSLRERMEMIDGQLQIDSAPGKGTRATVIAPMQLAGTVATGAYTPVGDVLSMTGAVDLLAEPAGADDGQIVRVLLADDHQVMRAGLAGLLRTLGDVKVLGQAADGLQAVDMALRLRPDIVIMDVSMPHLDGVEATRRIHSQLPGTRIIGLSMFNETNVQEAMLDAGAAAYLAKTSPPEALVAAIRECAGKRAKPQATPSAVRGLPPAPPP